MKNKEASMTHAVVIHLTEEELRQIFPENLPTDVMKECFKESKAKLKEEFLRMVCDYHSMFYAPVIRYERRFHSHNGKDSP